MAHDLQNLKTIVVRCLEPYGADIEFKAMFGGIMAYAYGRPFCVIWKSGLALKLSPTDTRELFVHEGAEPWRYDPDASPSQLYTNVPEAWLNKADELLPWLEKSIAYVKTLPLTPKKKRKSKA